MSKKTEVNQGERTIIGKIVGTHGVNGTMLILPLTDYKEQAELYRGSVITVSDDDRVELPDDEYWIDDMIGLSVVEFGTERELGTLEEIMFTGSNDVYMVKSPEGTLRPLPAIGEVINEVDIEAGIITVSIPEGLWD